MWPARCMCCHDSAYPACAATTSPSPHDASPISADAAARPRWSSAPARSSARWACAMQPAAVAEHQRLPGTVHGDRRGKRPEPFLVHHHHVRRPVLRSAAIRRRHGVQPPLGVPEVRLDALELTGGHERSHVVVAEHRPDPELRIGQRLHPAPQGPLLPEPLQGRGRQLDQVGCAVEVRGGESVVDGDGPLAVRLVPVARPPVQRRDLVGLLVQQARTQHVGEEVVVAVPPAAVVERDQEQVPPVQRLQHGPATAVAGDGITQRTAEPVQDGGLQKEALDRVGLPLQHLLDQVVDDVPRVSCEAGDEAADVVPALHRQRRQLEGRDPALGPTLQRRHVRIGELETHRTVEVGNGLLGREAQVGGAHLDQLAAGSKPGQRQCRVGATGDDEVQPAEARDRAGTPSPPAGRARR